MDKLFILMMVVAVAAAEYTAQDAADYTDQDNDGIISDSEFATYSAGFKSYSKARILAEFTVDANDEITLANFIAEADELIEDITDTGASGPEKEPEEFDENDDGHIDSGEFDDWYDDFQNTILALMKAQMVNEEGVITKAKFLGVLTYMASLV